MDRLNVIQCLSAKTWIIAIPRDEAWTIGQQSLRCDGWGERMTDKACDDEDPNLDAYRPYLRALAGIGLGRQLRAKVDESDIVQQTLLKAHMARERAPLQNPKALAGWLREILANELADAYKRFNSLKRNVGLEQSIAANLDRSSSGLERLLEGNFTPPEGVVEQREMLSNLSKALLSLPEDTREVIMLKHLEGCTIAEITQQTGKTPAAVAGLLRRGLAKLREVMDEPN